jgi:hypothetical protein
VTSTGSSPRQKIAYQDGAVLEANPPIDGTKANRKQKVYNGM